MGGPDAGVVDERDKRIAELEAENAALKADVGAWKRALQEMSTQRDILGARAVNYAGGW
jgi:cell division protein FtsB